MIRRASERPAKPASKPVEKPAKTEEVETPTTSDGGETPNPLEDLLKNPPLKCFSKEYEPKDKTCKACDYFAQCGEATALKKGVPFQTEEEEAAEEATQDGSEDVVAEEKPKKAEPPKTAAPKKPEGKKSIDDVLASLKKK